MDEKTAQKLTDAIVGFLNNLVRIADEENYDRDSFVTAAADIFNTMAAVSTFKHYGEEAQEDSHEN